MQSSVFIFHGTAGYPEENWFPWLKEKLEAKGCQVFVPQFPTPKRQTLDAWLEVLQPYRNRIDANSIFIGHSLGGVFLLRVLERLDHSIKAAFFVGTPIGLKPLKNYDSDYSFSGFDFNWPKIRAGAEHFTVFQSDDDPYVQLTNGEQLAGHLGVELTFVPHAGHFNTSAGYTTFQQLLDKIESVVVE